MSDETQTPVLVRKVLAEASLPRFLLLFAEHLKDGWDIDEKQPGDVYGYVYETTVYKDEKDMPKMSRADSTALARHGRKAKSIERANAEQAEQPNEAVE